ncbi:hypothetical protein MT962_003166 [Franconibacter sp. IITDAS19]|uniref:hypothetical protein n=1 Tax=Franconibacter sp. IITDAS19 TaxID=2930569 RepID=UPI001FFA573B|nr:hypothetical protein [Franconibacter sp. IITDAS19]MCK1969307.1 hypothetical protein [Franconibacter sp. IITDAS19]
MTKAEAVRTLIKKHLSKIEGNASLSTRKIAVLAKEAEEYFESLVVDLTGFTFFTCFPGEGSGSCRTPSRQPV